MIFLAAASVSQQGGTKMTGGNEYDAGGYHVHEFVSTGTLQVFRSTEVEYLVLGGGGGGSTGYSDTRAGAGGGAGELKEGTSLVIPKSNQNVTVGPGGIGGTYNVNPPNNTNGGDSSLGSLVHCLGGGKAVFNGSNGGNGGCGGGSSSNGSNTWGTAIGAGYGFRGSAGTGQQASYYWDGSIYYNTIYNGGSGGGTASVGTSVSVPGTARTSDITGTTESYGQGGAGGGMGSGTAVGAMDSTANRGGGGGGAYIMGWPSGGGSVGGLAGIAGVVIVRYPI